MNIRDRIVDFRRVKAADLRRNPRNWRKHPKAQQDALRGVLDEIGYADAAITRVLPDGDLEIIDGHLRQETTPEQEIPCIVTDLTEAEAAKLLATLDPLAAMAEPDPVKLDELLREVQTSSEAVAAMLTGLAEANGIVPDKKTGAADLRQLDIKPAPKLAWVLIGIPTVRFSEIANFIETIASADDVIVETVVGSGS